MADKKKSDGLPEWMKAMMPSAFTLGKASKKIKAAEQSILSKKKSK